VVKLLKQGRLDLIEKVIEPIKTDNMAMTTKDLDKIQAKNMLCNASFNIMNAAYKKRKNKRGVGTTQYPPFMFPPTTMKKGGPVCSKIKDRVISGKSLR